MKQSSEKGPFTSKVCQNISNLHMICLYTTTVPINYYFNCINELENQIEFELNMDSSVNQSVHLNRSGLGQRFTGCPIFCINKVCLARFQSKLGKILCILMECPVLKY